jgi:hypothetical protein
VVGASPVGPLLTQSGHQSAGIVARQAGYSGHRAIRPGGELLRRKVCVGHAHRRAGHRDYTRRTGCGGDLRGGVGWRFITFVVAARQQSYPPSPLINRCALLPRTGIKRPRIPDICIVGFAEVSITVL